MNLVFQQMYLKTAICIGFGKFLQVVRNTCRSKVQPDTGIIVMLARRHPPRNVLVAQLRYRQFSRSAFVQYNILLLYGSFEITLPKRSSNSPRRSVRFNSLADYLTLFTMYTYMLFGLKTARAFAPPRNTYRPRPRLNATGCICD